MANITIRRSIDEIGRESWEKLKIQSCYQTYGWVKNVELQRKGSSFYIEISEENQILAIAICYLTSNPSTYPPYNLNFLVNGGFNNGEMEDADRIINTNNNTDYFPNLLCVTREGYSGGVLFNQNLDIQQEDWISKQIINGLTDLAISLQCQAAAFLYLPEENPLAKNITTDFISLNTGCDAYIKIRWNCFEEYVNSFENMKHRKLIYKEVAAPEKKGYRFARESLQTLPLDKLANLLYKSETNHGHKNAGADHLLERLEFNQRLPLENLVFTAYKNEEIVAFDLFYRSGDKLYGRLVGIDRNLVPPEDYIYFNIAFYQPIDYAINNGITEIDYGMGSLASKTFRKCDLRQKYSYISKLNR